MPTRCRSPAANSAGSSICWCACPPTGPAARRRRCSVHLLNRAGAAMNELQGGAGAESSGEQQIDLPLAALPPGEYVLEIKAGDQDGERDRAGRLPRHRLTRCYASRSLRVASLVASGGDQRSPRHAAHWSDRLVTVDLTSPTRAAARSPISNRRISSCAKARCAARIGAAVRFDAAAPTNAAGLDCSPPPTNGWPPRQEQDAAVRDLSRRVSCRQRSRRGARSRDVDPLRRSRSRRRAICSS